MANDDLSFKHRAFHREAALYWNNHANQRQFELAKQLITIGSLILTVSATAIVSFRGINFQTQPLQSYSLILSWVFVLISIFCGFKQLVVDTSYFNSLSNDESTREDKYYRFPYDRAKAEVDSMKQTSPRGDEKWLLLQQIFFALGVVFITISAIFILSLTT